MDMSTVDELLTRLRQANVRLWVDKGQIRYSAPKGALTAEIIAQITEHKDELRSLLQVLQSSPAPPPTDLTHQPYPEYPPLSFAQERIWFLHQLEGDQPAYNVFKAYKLTGRLNVDQLRQCLGDVVARHEVLRMTFPDRGGVPYQHILAAIDVPLPFEDLEGLGETDRAQRIEDLCLALVKEPFDLVQGPLFRTKIVHLGRDQHLLFLAMHHIITDGWSIDVLVREMVEAYLRRGSSSEQVTPELPIQYTDFTLWQRAWLTDENLPPYFEFWERELAGAPEVTTLTPDNPRPAEASFRGANLPIHLGDKLSASVHQLASQIGSTPFMVIMAGLVALLHRYTGMEDLVIGTPVANRTHVDLEGLIGFFVNTLALRFDLSGEPTFEQLLEHTRAQTLRALTYQDLPFELLVKRLQTERDLSRNPIFQIMVSMRVGPGHPTEMDGVQIEAFPLDTQVSRFDLNLMLWQRDSEISGHWEYSTDLYDRTTIERFSNHFLRFLQSIVSDPRQVVSSIPLLEKGERNRLLNQWGSSTAAISSVACVHELFEAQVERTPLSSALEMDGRTLSYEALNTRANQLAHRLRANGICPNDRIGIFMPRSMEMIVAILGILKAGGAYVPLDLALPQARIEMMLKDAGVKVLLTKAGHETIPPPFDGIFIGLDDSGANLAGEPENNPRSSAKGDDLVYVTYTSGSTGMPKGVAMPHRALVNMLTWQLGHTSVPSARTLQFTTLGFDVSFQEILATLAGGGTLILISEDERQDFRLLARRLAELRVERIFLPYSALQLLAEVLVQEGAQGLKLKEVITAGEQLRITPAIEQLYRSLGECVLHNQYGPTEAHVVTVYTLRGEPGSWPLLPPIGQPISNVEVYILDSQLEPVPVGVVGELYVGGLGLAHGYLNRPEENKERFIKHPFSSDPRARLFRTGDLTRFMPDWEIRFLGRRDEQVKIRGYRVELGEIEAVLGQHEDVSECVVRVHQERTADVNLWAYIVPRAKSNPSRRGLRSYLRSRLPEYMIPSRFFALNEIPLTSSGKINRVALSTIEAQELGEPEKHAAPSDPLESQIAAVWEQVLGIQPVGANDNFFDLGGHSMLALQLLSALKHATGVELSVAALFRAPTVAEQAQIIRRRDWNIESASLVPIREGEGGKPIYFIHWAGGSVTVYRELIQLLEPGLRIFGIQAHGLDRSVRPHTSVEQMAVHYIREIKELQPHGPYFLAGASMGGSIAFEMARHLEAQGEQVGLVALFDAVGRPNLGALPLRERARLHAGNIREHESQTALGYLFERTVIRLRRMIYAAVIGLGIPLPRMMWNLRETTYYAFKHYQPGEYKGDVVLFRALERGPGSPKSLFLGWEQVVPGRIKIINVPGMHSTMLSQPNVRFVAKELDDLLQDAREGPSPPMQTRDQGSKQNG
jgi:amino acid adenylation domain-containing protein